MIKPVLLHHITVLLRNKTVISCNITVLLRNKTKVILKKKTQKFKIKKRKNSKRCVKDALSILHG